MRGPGPISRTCLIGVRGVGKTTFIRSVLAELPNVDYIVGSAVLRQLAGPEFERFDFLPLARKEYFRRASIQHMEERQAQLQKHILCDGHTALLDESTGKVEDVFTEEDCRFFDSLVLLEAPLEVVLTRRRSDPSKRRSLDPEILKAEITCEQENSARIARQWGMELHVLPLDAGHAKDRFLEVMRR